MGQTYTYQAGTNSIAVTDTGDFFQLRNGTNALVELKSIRVFQTSDTTLAMNAVNIIRGDTGAGGVAMVEHEYGNITGPTAVAAALSLATTDVTNADLSFWGGWNILQEFVWLPTPELQIELVRSDHLGLALAVADTLTIGVNVIWDETHI